MDKYDIKVGKYYKVNPTDWSPVIAKCVKHEIEKGYDPVFEFTIDNYFGKKKEVSSMFWPSRVDELTDDEWREFRLKNLLDE